MVLSCFVQKWCILPWGMAFVLPFKTGVLKYWRKPDEVHDRPVGLQSSAEAKMPMQHPSGLTTGTLTPKA